MARVFRMAIFDSPVKSLLPAALLLLGMLFSLDAAAVTAGRILFANGEVNLARGADAPRKARRGDLFEVGDKISTGTQSSAQLRFTDGALVALNADSMFVIEKHNFNKDDPGKGEQAAELLRGGLRAITGAIGHENPEAVNYRTPVATIGIRGTVYEVIYVPPGGLPGLPGVEPGQYTMLLRGQVLLSNGGGELMLGAGEIGYIADENSPPVLRPDLYEIFAKYAGFDEEEYEDGDDETQVGEDESEGIEDETGGMAGARPTYGPFALVVSDVQFGRFMSTPVTVSGGELISATGGSGAITSFTALATAFNVGGITVGDSDIYWGSYGYMDYTPSTGWGIDYIDATQVIVSTDDLPTVGSYTYNYAGGTGASLDPTSHLTVDFASNTMSVALDTTFYGSWTVTNKSIDDFYGGGMSLSNAAAGDGVIVGRFVGSNAEGAISAFSLDILDGYISGVAAFAQ